MIFAQKGIKIKLKSIKWKLKNKTPRYPFFQLAVWVAVSLHVENGGLPIKGSGLFVEFALADTSVGGKSFKSCRKTADPRITQKFPTFLSHKYRFSYHEQWLTERVTLYILQYTLSVTNIIIYKVDEGRITKCFVLYSVFDCYHTIISSNDLYSIRGLWYNLDYSVSRSVALP